MKDIKLMVSRSDPESGKGPEIKEYYVPFEDGMVVLDALRYVQEKIDHTLAIRWNCKAGRCGSCSVEINGIPRLACKTRVDFVGEKIRVEPIKAFPIVKDLVSDISSNWETARMVPEIKIKDGMSNPYKIHEMDVERSQEFKKCIECFLCHDVCHVIREHKAKYIGPRYVIKAAELDMHPFDTLDRSKMLKEEGGVGFCNVTKCCQEVCPQHIKITDNAIIPEKERIVDNFYDPLIGIFRLFGGRGRR